MPDQGYHASQAKDGGEKSLDEVRHENQFWNVGHGREPLFGGEYAIEMTAHERRRTRRLHSFAVLSLLLVSLCYSAWSTSFRTYGLGSANNRIQSDTDAFDWNTV